MYELPVSTEEYKKQQDLYKQLVKPIDPWRGGPLRGYEVSEDEIKIVKED